MKSEWIWGEGQVPSKIMIVGEAPATEEVKAGRPFVGKSGIELEKYLQDIGLSREDVYITNLSKVPLESNKKLWDVDMMGALLEKEIADVDPQFILSLGAISSYWFLPDAPHDMETISGIPHKWRDKIVIPSFHPAAAFHDTAVMKWIQEAFLCLKMALNGLILAVTWQQALPTKICNLNDVAGGNVWAIDTETTRNKIPWCLSTTSKEGVATVIKANDQENLMKLKSYLSDAELVVFHNALFDISILKNMGIEIPKFTDTMQIAFLLQTQPLGLKNLAYRLAGMRLKNFDDVVGDKDWSDVAPEIANQYAGEDADATLRIYNKMLPLWYPRMNEILQRDIDIMPMVIEMEKRGVKINVDKLHEIESEFFIQNLCLKEQIQDIVGEDFNLAAPAQVAKILYEKLKLGKNRNIRRTQHGGSIDKKSISKIQNEHPVVNMIRKWRETNDLICKYLVTLPKWISTDGRIHADISMTRVKHSGRFATSKPNLLAQPVRTSDGRKIREAYEAPEGYWLYSFDYSQIEMRLIAHLSQDPVMSEWYRQDKDVHTYTAMQIFGISDPRDVDEKKHRYPSKRAGFEIIYLVSARGLSDTLRADGCNGWDEVSCQKLIDDWLGLFSGIKTYIEERKTYARRYRQVTDFWGRMVYCPEMQSALPYIVEERLRKAVNQDMQSGAQGIIKEAMKNLWPMTKQWIIQKQAYPLLQIHDALLFEIRKDCEWIIPIIQQVMENSVILSVPLKVGIKSGTNWE